MGIFDKIKELYNKADTAVGGYLPGGSTPAEVKAPTPAYNPPPATRLPSVTSDAISQVTSTPAGTQSTGANPTAPTRSNASRVSNTSSGRSTLRSDLNGTEQLPVSPPVSAPVSVTPTIGKFNDGTIGWQADPDPQNKLQQITGQFTSGLFNKQDPTGRDFLTQENPTQAGRMINYVGNIALLGTGGEALLNYGYKAYNSIRGVKAIKSSEPVVKNIQSIADDGLSLFENGGTAKLASKSPSATGVTTDASGALSLDLAAYTKNTKNTKTVLDYIKGLFVSNSGKISIGGILGVGTVVGWAIYGDDSASLKISQINKDAPQAIKDLREAGLHDEANELENSVTEINDRSIWDRLNPIQRNIVGGKKTSIDLEINNYEEQTKQIIADQKQAHIDEVASFDAKLKTNTPVTDEEAARIAGLNKGGLAEQYLLAKEQTLLTQQLIDEEDRIYDRQLTLSDEEMVNDPEIRKAYYEADSDSPIKGLYDDALDRLSAQRKLDQQAKLDASDRAYSEQRQEEQRDYNEQQQAEQRSYSEGQQTLVDATATEASGSSALNFGLLNSSGEIEFVDRDAASNVYFGKTFEELTPAQKKLLMLSKGK